jgi:Ca-activated chloride channel family protein
MAAEISPAIMPKPGDDLAGALQLAARTLGETGGSIVVVADTVTDINQAALKAFRDQYRLPVYFLAVARADTPELDAIKQTAGSLQGRVTTMTADGEDIQSLVRQTASAPIAVSATGEGTRWAEAGWWLVPLLVVLSLFTFRRQGYAPSQEAHG